MGKMRAVEVPHAKGPFQLVEREIPEPPAGYVRIKVQACGICHSDEYAKEGSRPGITYPRIPGHEVAGIIDAVGADVLGWQTGQRAGVGWHGGHCGYCDSCRRGDFVTCSKGRQITGLTRDGGYADYVIVSAGGLVPIPDALSPEEAAPLLCAGVTTFNALRNGGARDGDLVAVLGLGGLGHLGVQFAAKMGFDTVSIARGKEKEAFARKLGARHYIDSQTQDAAAELEKLGGAESHPLDRHQRESRERSARRNRHQRQAGPYRESRPADRSNRAPFDRGPAIDQRLAIGEPNRLAGHAVFLRAERHAADDPVISAGTRRGSL